jgi:hypothetical protein
VGVVDETILGESKCHVRYAGLSVWNANGGIPAV